MKRLLLVLLIIPLLIIIVPGTIVNGQQSTTNTGTATTQEIPTSTVTSTTLAPQIKEDIQQTATDSTLPIAGGTIATTAAAAIGLLINDRKDKKKLETKIDHVEVEQEKKKKEIDSIMTNLAISNYKIFYAAYLYPERTLKQILDLKATNNPLEKNTLGELYATDINKLGQYVQINYNLPMPNMSVASPQVIQASSMLNENKPVSTVVTTTPPPTQQQTKVITQEPANQTATEASVVAEQEKSNTIGEQNKTN
jgi:competence protein ComGC